jgi:hypothetical protein
MKYLTLKLGCTFSSILYIGNYNLFYSAWTAQHDKIIGFITGPVHGRRNFFSNSSVHGFEAHDASYSMGAEGLDPWSKVVGA